MKNINSLIPLIAVPISTMACAAKNLETGNIDENITSINEALRKDIIEMQDNAHENNIRLESLVRAVYTKISPDANMAEFLDNDLVITINPCERDDYEIKNLVDDMLSSSSPWETKRIFLENLSSQPALLNAFKKTNTYANLVHEYSSLRCKEPSLLFYVSADTRLIAKLKFCEKVVETDITDLKLSSNLDWLRDHESGTCDDRVMVFPYNTGSSIEVQKHSRDLYTIVSPQGVSIDGDLTALYPEMSLQKQNISNYMQAVIDLDFYNFNYLSPSIIKAMKKTKEDVNAQKKYVVSLLLRNFENLVSINSDQEDSFVIDTSGVLIKVDIVLVDGDYYYLPKIIVCNSDSDCEESIIPNLSMYSSNKIDKLDLNELIWWLDTNYISSYTR